MDQYLSTVIIALISGVFSIITIVIQKKQDKVISKIDEQTMFIEREKSLKQKLIKKEKERELLIQEIMLLILDTNLYILKNTDVKDPSIPIDSVFEISDDLKKRFENISNDINEINKEYEMLLNLSNDFQKEMEQGQNKK